YSPLPFAVLRVGEVFFDLYKRVDAQTRRHIVGAGYSLQEISPLASNYSVFCPLSSDSYMGL
ncbi:hypothetical protein, partial [Desulfocastanea catecholica]